MGNYANDLDSGIYYCHLPNKRWKIRRIKTGYDKLLRRFEKESYQIDKQIRNLGYEPLDKPIQAGYKRLFILTEETKHSKNIDFYQGILDKINTVRYSSTKIFENQRTSKRWRRRKRKIKEQILLEPNSHTFHDVLKFTEDEKRLFYRIKYYCHQCKKDHVKYVFSEPWRFMLRIRPHWITEVVRKDTVLEQKRDELDDFLDQYKNKARLTKMRGGWGSNRYYPDVKEKYSYDPLKNTQLNHWVEEYNNAKEIWEYNLKN